MANPLPEDACILQHSLDGHKAAVLSLVFTQNGRYLLSASQDKSLRLWNPHSGALLKSFAGPHNHEVTGVVVTDDNSQFYSCGGDKHFFCWDVATAQVTRKFVGHDRKVNALALGPRAEVVMSASHDKTARIWDLRTRNRSPIQVLREARDSVLCVHRSGDEIVTGSTDGGLRRYDVRKAQLCVDELLQPVGSVSFSNDAQCVLVSTLDDKIQLLEKSNGTRLATYQGHRNKRFKVQSTFDPSCSLVVSGSEDNRIFFWDLADSDSKTALQEHAGAVFCVAFSGETLATASADGAIRIWNTTLESRPAAQLSTVPTGPAVGTEAENSLPTSFGKQERQRGNRGKKRRRPGKGD